MPRISSTPCSVPSSPGRPCSTLRATSGLTVVSTVAMSRPTSMRRDAIALRGRARRRKPCPSAARPRARPTSRPSERRRASPHCQCRRQPRPRVPNWRFATNKIEIGQRVEGHCVGCRQAESSALGRQRETVVEPGQAIESVALPSDGPAGRIAQPSRAMPAGMVGMAEGSSRTDSQGDTRAVRRRASHFVLLEGRWRNLPSDGVDRSRARQKPSSIAMQAPWASTAESCSGTCARRSGTSAPSPSGTRASRSAPTTTPRCSKDLDLSLLTFDYLQSSGACIVGGPERCLEIARRYDAADCDLLLCLLNPYKIPHRR